MNKLNTTSLNTTPSGTTTETRGIRLRLSAVVLVASLGLVACGSDDSSSSAPDQAAEVVADDGAIAIADPWSRQPAVGQTTSAVYGAVTNATDQAVTAVAASTDVAKTVELHQVTMNDEGQMSMSEKEGGYTIGAGETFVFEPGGPHIMLLDIDPATYPEAVDVSLEFDDGTTLDFTAEVRAIGADEMEMNDETEMKMETDEG